MLENVSIILVEPQGDENIGMVARAMKNCGVTDLRLVKPTPFRTKGAEKWACDALDVLNCANTYRTLSDAVSDVSLVIALSRREGKLRPPSMPHEKAASAILSRTKKGRVALVFGREADGLKKSELDLCDYVWALPTSQLYPSLNLAQAVMVAGHELFKKLKPPHPHPLPLGKGERRGEGDVFVSKKEITPVLKRLSDALMRLGYDDSDGGKLRGKIIHEFERLFGRGGLFRKDLNMFLGLAARIEGRVKE